MMKIITLLSKENKFIVKEDFRRIIPIIEKYFVGGGSHTVVSSFEATSNEIHVFPEIFDGTFNQCNSCEHRNENNVVNLEIDANYIENVFFDWRSRKPSCTIINLTYRGGMRTRFAGFYCRKYNSLYLTDWTHCVETSDVAEVVLPQLIEKLDLKPIDGEIISDEIIQKYIVPDYDVVLGADPEFEENSTLTTYSPRRTDYRSTSSAIGSDGSGDQIEIRPQPANTPEGLVNNIRELIKVITLEGKYISVKGDRFPLGAHIHFQIPEKLRSNKFVEAMCHALDDFIGKPLIDLSGSARDSYKQLTSYEVKRYGFEYRTPPSAILHNPEIARIVFKIAKNVVQNLIRNGILRYNDPPTKEDYMDTAQITEEEYNYFREFIEKYKTEYRGNAINANWCPITELKLSVRPTFKDDWLTDNEMYVRKLVSDYANKYKDKLHGPYEIIFYGLRKDRGNVVAGFEIDGYMTIEHPNSNLPPEISFGIPYALRMDPLEEVKDELERVVTAAIETFFTRIMM